MTAISRKKYINKLDNISNNIYQRKTKMKSADVNSSSYIDKAVETNDKDPKFEVGNHVRIQKYKEILAKGYKANCLEEDFVIRKRQKQCNMDMSHRRP